MLNVSYQVTLGGAVHAGLQKESTAFALTVGRNIIFIINTKAIKIIITRIIT